MIARTKSPISFFPQRILSIAYYAKILNIYLPGTSTVRKKEIMSKILLFKQLLDSGMVYIHKLSKEIRD